MFGEESSLPAIIHVHVCWRAHLLCQPSVADLPPDGDLGTAHRNCRDIFGVKACVLFGEVEIPCNWRVLSGLEIKGFSNWKALEIMLQWAKLMYD